MATKKQKSWTERAGVRQPRTPTEAASEAVRRNREAADKKAAADKAHDDLVKKLKQDAAAAKKRAVRNSLDLRAPRY
jgi:hypothetical protein